jgi:hypothetical protein
LGAYPLDVVRVGDPDDLPLATEDPALLLWAEREQRILVTHDLDTMPAHLADHLAAGHHSPGVLMIRPRSTLPQIFSFLRDAAYASESGEWQDQIHFIPRRATLRNRPAGISEAGLGRPVSSHH